MLPGHPDKLCDAVADSIIDWHWPVGDDLQFGIEVACVFDRVFVTGRIANPSTEARTAFRIGRDEIVRERLRIGRLRRRCCRARVGTAAGGSQDRVGALLRRLRRGRARAAPPLRRPGDLRRLRAAQSRRPTTCRRRTGSRAGSGASCARLRSGAGRRADRPRRQGDRARHAHRARRRVPAGPRLGVAQPSRAVGLAAAAARRGGGGRDRVRRAWRCPRSR